MKVGLLALLIWGCAVDGIAGSLIVRDQTKHTNGGNRKKAGKRRKAGTSESGEVDWWIESMLSKGRPGENPEPIFPGGRRILFAGHSFFIPVALTFNSIANSMYSGHTSLEPVLSSGSSGSPKKLWNNDKKHEEIIEGLQRHPQALALTFYTGTVQEDYQRWLNEAKKHVTNISLLIFIPFSPNGAIESMSVYHNKTQNGIKQIRKIALKLKADNPHNDIFVIEHASISLVMKRMLKQGQLDDDMPDGQLCSKADKEAGKVCLFRDKTPGHPAKMAYHMAALTWLHILYGMDAMAYTRTQVFQEEETLQRFLKYQEKAVCKITTVAINSNEWHKLGRI